MTKKSAPKAQADNTFGISIRELFGGSLRAWSSAIVPLTGAALLTFAIYAPFRIQAQSLLDDDLVYRSLAIDLVGLLVSGTAAVPWYSYALDAAAGRTVDLRRPFRSPRPYFHQAVASFWFWAAILLGLRYLLGLPSIFVLILYAFHGFFIADGPSKGGMIALGNSVRLTEGKRIGLFAIACLLFVVNLLGAAGLGIENLALPVRGVLAALGLAVTTSISMVIGATIYLRFKKGLT